MSKQDDRDFILGIRTGKQNHAWATVMQDEPRTYLDGTPKGCVEAKAPEPNISYDICDHDPEADVAAARKLAALGFAQQQNKSDVDDMTPEQQERYCTLSIRRSLGHGPDQDAEMDQEIEQAQQRYEDYLWRRDALLWTASPIPDCTTLQEMAEKLGCPVSAQEWGKLAGMDMDLLYPTKCQPIGVDKADLFANGVVGIPHTTPDRTIVPVWPTKIWLNGRDVSSMVVAGSVKLTEPYYGSGVPNLQFNMLVDAGEPAALKLGMKCLVEITEPAPLGALTSTWFVGPVECFYCLDASSRDYETKLMQVKCQGIGLKEDDMVTIKNSTDQTIHLPGGTDVPPENHKVYLVTLAETAVAWSDRLFIAKEAGFNVESNDLLGFCADTTTGLVTYQVASVDGDEVVLRRRLEQDYPAGTTALLHRGTPETVRTTRAHQGIQPNIPKPVANPHGEFANQYPDCGLFVTEADKQETWENLTRHKLAALGVVTVSNDATPEEIEQQINKVLQQGDVMQSHNTFDPPVPEHIAVNGKHYNLVHRERDENVVPPKSPGANDLHLHGIASLDGDFMLHGPAGETIMEVHATGDDVLVLHLLHRGSNDPNPVVQPVLWVKRWGEVKVAPGLHHHMGDLAQRFWRAVAQVHRDLPQPVSPKQEAILAFLNERHMTLAEFDRQYYARPILHPSEVGRGTHETAVWEIMEIGK